MTKLMTEEEVYRETREDLAGKNGAAAREATLRGLVRLQGEMMMSRLMVFGAGTARVMRVGDEVLVSKR